MSNEETWPQETVCGDEAQPPHAPITLLQPREVPLGGLRAMHVRRTLPQRDRTLIGAWCFLDHYGPEDVQLTGGMNVAAHPHIGLQTASWLFAGVIEHRDSSGAHALVRPGEINLMTAGSGISHSERSTESTTQLHGVQLWIALPEHARNSPRGFEFYKPPILTGEGWAAQVFVGSLLGSTSPVRVHSALVGAEINLLPGASLELELERDFEHGLLVDYGILQVSGAAGETAAVSVPQEALCFISAGESRVRLTAGEHGTKVILIGGVPPGEQLVMWWNFVGRSHEDIALARSAWHAEISGGAAERVFGLPENEPEAPLPAPPLPLARLKPRD